ncbi:hypothetical protein CGMCC3_g17189 [Colletotrichum fructicola]|nr:uncharacterized protein CGMCC3_g17189 [Colletotrichum fructicola]KAE9566649.1 hypothetical protein CGMCC3_g17189 [Colletotrichum fructicola]KAF4417667.1 hypothetical protein CFRS1_v015151 [Colletotrichum fructicola]
MAWTAPAGSTSTARVAKIASSIIARVKIRGLELIDERKQGERAHVSAALYSPELTLFIPNVQYFLRVDGITCGHIWKQGSSEKRTNAKAESTICDDHKGPDTAQSNAIHMRPPRQSRLSIG